MKLTEHFIVCQLEKRNKQKKQKKRRINPKKVLNQFIQLGTFIALVMCILNSFTMVSGHVVGSMDTGPIIGIDLGTTQSVVSVYENGKVTIIPNDQGNRLTPSIVSFYENDRLIGDSAYNVMNKNPKNTIFEAKRFIGRKYSDETVQKDIKLLPFDVINKNNKPYFRVEFDNKIHEYSAEEISAMVLTKMKQTAEQYLGKKIEKAVITVPAYFDDLQRQATKDSGTIAGLDVVRIINEPTSAAIAYGIDKRSESDKNREMNVIVFDLGGGTYDVSLLTLDEGIFEVQANGGDTHLGGSDFDENILKYMIKQFKKKTGLDIITNDKALSKLRKECEKAKRALSSIKQIKIEIENLMNGYDFSELLTRARFEDLNLKLFKKTIKPLKRLLSDSNLKKNDIDEVILVGGSTRIPKIQQLVSEFFNGKELNRGINPDEAVAYGASIQGAIISGLYGSNGEDPIGILNSTPLSLGIETVGEIMTKIIDRNSMFPTEKSKIFSTHQDNQDSVLIQIYQGERAMTKDNRFLGKFMISGIQPKPRGIPQIEVSFGIDANGILQVEAYDKSNKDNTKQTITITRDDHNNLSQNEIDKMIEEQQKWAEKDEEILKTINAKNKLESDVHSIKNKIIDLNEQNEINSDDYDQLSELCEDIIEWLQENQQKAEYDDYYEKQQEFDQIVNHIFNQYKGGGNDDYDYTDHEDL